MYNFDEIIDRKHTNAMNTDGFRDYIFHADESMKFPYKDEEFIRMWVADMEFATPDVVIEGIEERLKKRIFGYTRVFSNDYYDAFVSWCQKRYDWSFEKKELVMSNGIIPALYELVNYICKKASGHHLLFRPHDAGPLPCRAQGDAPHFRRYRPRKRVDRPQGKLALHHSHRAARDPDHPAREPHGRRPSRHRVRNRHQLAHSRPPHGHQGTIRSHPQDRARHPDRSQRLGRRRHGHRRDHAHRPRREVHQPRIRGDGRPERPVPQHGGARLHHPRHGYARPGCLCAHRHAGGPGSAGIQVLAHERASVHRVLLGYFRHYASRSRGSLRRRRHFGG